MLIDIIIPAFNEQDSIVHVVNDIPNYVRDIVVVDNNSTDKTASNATKAGATVVKESRKGYGWACLKGMEYIQNKEIKPDVIIFLDGDYSDYPEEMSLHIQEIENGADMVIGNRVGKKRAKGSMTPQQVFGNWLACWLMKVLYGYKYHDLGPFRAIKWDRLMQIKMQDKTYGWTVEMQLKALKHHFKIAQVDVTYRKRIGVSKVSGTVKGTILAGYKIITTIFKYR